MRRIEVVAAVILRGDGRFLLAQRPAGKVYAGYWEFPGGKIENGETPADALRRELHEELGLEVVRVYSWITRDYDYPHAAVRLRFFRVAEWHGEPHGKEAQRLAWQSTRELTVSPLLPANGPVLRALDLPPVYAITHAAALGQDEFLGRLGLALARGLRLLQVREKSMDPEALRAFATRTIAIARRHGARVLVNGATDLARELGADGVHLTSVQLLQVCARPDFDLVGVSCHNFDELARAVEIGADFVVLGPVLPTPSHPDARGLGWRRFEALIRNYPIPVYALGGMQARDLPTAWQAGAHGVGMMRAAWEKE